MFAPLLAFDVLITAAATIAFAQTSIFDLRVALILISIRLVVWIAVLHRRLAPLRGWWEDPCDATLFEADARAQRLTVSFSRIYSATWFANGLIQLLVAEFLGIALVGPAEVLAVALLGISTSVGTLALTQPLLDNALVPTQLELSSELRARGLSSTRSPMTLARRSMNLIVGFMFAAIVGMGGMLGNARVEALRESALTEARTALALELASASTDSGRTHEADQLPPVLERQLESGALPQSVFAAYDPRTQAAWAAVALEEGRWLLARVEGNEKVLEYGTFIVGFGLLVGLAAAFVAYAQSRAIESPLEQLGQAALSFARDGDLRALDRLASARNDQVGQLSTYFNAMLDTLEELAAAAEAVAAGDLRTSLDQSLERPGELHDAFRGMLTQLRETVSQLSATASAMAHATAQLTTLTEDQDQSARLQSERTHMASTSLAALVSSARDIATAAKEVLGDAEGAELAGRAMSKEVASLELRTTVIAELLQGIREVADRSDLLALNGALEATRAGELGRGFALVASEMRRLSERVAALVNDVDAQLAPVRQTGAKVVKASLEHEALAVRTATAARRISSLTELQSDEMSSAAEGLAEMSIEVEATVETTSRTRSAVANLRTHADLIEELSERFEID